MMLYRLVRLIETHSKALAACLLARVQISEATPDYRNVPPEELKTRVYEIYSHLGAPRLILGDMWRSDI